MEINALDVVLRAVLSGMEKKIGSIQLHLI